MSTTALIIEFLVTGLQTAIWLGLTILLFFGFDWIDLNRIRGLEAFATAVLIPILYPLGMFIDNLSDYLSKRWNQKIKEKYIQDKSVTAIKLLVTTKDEWLSRYFDYNRVKLRIIRSSALNFFIITLVLPILTIKRLHAVLGSSMWKVVLFELILGTIFTGLAIWTWQSVADTFYAHLKLGLDMLPKLSDQQK